jgi:hypothetical protein
MGPDVIAVFIPIVGAIGAFGIVGLKIWTNHQQKMREVPDGDNERLAEAVQDLYDELGTMREDFAELQERLDFTERSLTEARSKKGIGPGDSA